MPTSRSSPMPRCLGHLPAHARPREEVGVRARASRRHEEDRSSRCPTYDFNWQTYYMFKEPLQVPEGRAARLERVVRQLGGEQVEPRSQGRREVGRPDVGGNAVHRAPLQPERQRRRRRRAARSSEPIAPDVAGAIAQRGVLAAAFGVCIIAGAAMPASARTIRSRPASPGPATSPASSSARCVSCHSAGGAGHDVARDLRRGATRGPARSRKKC